MAESMSGKFADSGLLALLEFDAVQERVYRLLIEAPGSEVGALVKDGLDAESVNRALTVLVDRGLASAEHDGDVPRYRAASPSLALGSLLESRRAALHRVEHLVGELADSYRAAQSRTSGAPVEVLSGAAAIRRRLLAMQREARYEIRSLVPAMSTPAIISFEDNLDEAERESMGRGVSVRSVLERAWLENESDANCLGRLAAEGQRIAIIETLPIKVVIVDHDVALLPLDPERDEKGEPIALVVHRSGLLTALISLFEQYFGRGWLLGGDAFTGSNVARPAGSAPPDPVDRQIVALLYVGLTDAAIARQLGIGHRTVQRRLAALMESVGAVTRFQLGWHAAAARWLDTDRPLA